MPEFQLGKRYRMSGNGPIDPDNGKFAGFNTYDLIGQTVEIFAGKVSIGHETVTEENRMSFAIVMLRYGVEFVVLESVTSNVA